MAREYDHRSKEVSHVGMQCCSYGYDPLGLGKDTEQVEKYRAYELIHARWAMLAAAGIIIPEGLQVEIMSFLCRRLVSTTAAWLFSIIASIFASCAR